jgi:uncharacterized protein YdaU (DUF1376 family)
LAKRPFLLLYINDFLSAVTVTVMDNDQFAWYLRLLMRAWQNEPPCCLPNNDYLLMTMAGVRDNKKERMNWDAKKKLVLSNFALDKDGVWLRNAKLDKEFDKMVEATEKKQQAGKRGAEKKWQTHGTAMATPSTPIAEVRQPIATQMSDVIHEKRTKTLSAVADERYKPFIEDLEKYWTKKNRDVPFSVSPADGRNLKQFLRDNPKVDRELFRKCLNHRARSPAVHTQKIHKWVLNVLEFANGTLDRFNKPEEHTGKSEPIRRANADSETQSLAALGVTDADRELLQTRLVASGEKPLAGAVDEVPIRQGARSTEGAHGIAGGMQILPKARTSNSSD